MKIRVIVGAFNSEGAPELIPLEVECSDTEYSRGDHYDIARDMAADMGYEPAFHFDERDPAWNQFRPAVVPAVPIGWHIDRDGDELLVRAPNGNGTWLKNRADLRGRWPLAERLLYNLAGDLLGPGQGEQEQASAGETPARDRPTGN